MFIFLEVIVIPAKIYQMLLEDAMYRNEMLTNHILASVDNISVVCCIIVTLLAKSNTPIKRYGSSGSAMLKTKEKLKRTMSINDIIRVLKTLDPKNNVCSINLNFTLHIVGLVCVIRILSV